MAFLHLEGEGLSCESGSEAQQVACYSFANLTRFLEERNKWLVRFHHRTSGLLHLGLGKAGGGYMSGLL